VAPKVEAGTVNATLIYSYDGTCYLLYIDMHVRQHENDVAETEKLIFSHRCIVSRSTESTLYLTFCIWFFVCQLCDGDAHLPYCMVAGICTRSNSI
jgi:hypothetical protein